MKKVILLVASFMLLCGSASAQGILRNLGERAKNAVENAVGEKVENAINNAVNKATGKKDDNKSGNNAAVDDEVDAAERQIANGEGLDGATVFEGLRRKHGKV